MGGGAAAAADGKQDRETLNKQLLDLERPGSIDRKELQGNEGHENNTGGQLPSYKMKWYLG